MFWILANFVLIAIVVLLCVKFIAIRHQQKLDQELEGTTSERNGVTTAMESVEEISVMAINGRMNSTSTPIPPFAARPHSPPSHIMWVPRNIQSRSHISENASTNSIPTNVTAITSTDGTVTTIARTGTAIAARRWEDNEPTVGQWATTTLSFHESLHESLQRSRRGDNPHPRIIPLELLMAISRSKRQERIEKSLEIRMAIPLSHQATKPVSDEVVPQEKQGHANDSDETNDRNNTSNDNISTSGRNDVLDVEESNLDNDHEDDDDESDGSSSYITTKEAFGSSGGNSWYFQKSADHMPSIVYFGKSREQEFCSICLEPYDVGDIVARMKPHKNRDHSPAFLGSGDSTTTQFCRTIPMGNDICPHSSNNRASNRCNHWFHKQCIHDWLQDHNDCPLCRVEMIHSENGIRCTIE